MAGGLNKQPIFTATPLLVSKTIDPVRFLDKIYSPNDQPPADFFVATDDYGTLIERITVSSVGDLTNPTVSEKFVYLFIFDNNTGEWVLYKTGYIPATTIDATTLNPTIEWVFTGGLLLPDNFKIGIGASKNYNDSAPQYQGDKLAVTLEGSSYSIPA